MKKTVKKVKPIRPKFSLIPRSTAENAYQLLDEVIAAIRDEPARLNMGQWRFTPKQVGALGDAAPSCGTVGCMAGWITFLVDRKVGTQHAISHRVCTLLGVEGFSQRADVYDNLFSAGGGDLYDTKPGTKAHADAVVARIRKYQRDNNAHLIETPVVPA